MHLTDTFQEPVCVAMLDRAPLCLACLQVTRLIRRKVLFEDDIAKAMQVRTHLVTDFLSFLVQKDA